MVSKRINSVKKQEGPWKEGVDALANTVKVTLGPKGRNWFWIASSDLLHYQ
jgi:chaperonin GroEL (HSP60 family)